MKIHYGILLVNLFFLFNFLKSQQEALFNHTANNLYLISSAAAGHDDRTHINLLYKKNWLGFAASPEMRGIAADGAFEKNCGWGIKLLDNSAGMFRSTNFLLSFRYRLQLTKNQHLSFGISGGLCRQSIDFSQIKAQSPDEFYNWPQKQASTLPDVNAGLMYQFKKTELLFGAEHLLQDQFLFTDPSFHQQVSYQQLPSFVVMARQTINWHSNAWAFVPAIIVRSVLGLPALVEVNTLFSYDNKVHFGALARSSKTIAATIGYGKPDAMRILYSYEYDQNIYSMAKGGHEISLFIGIGSNKKTK